MTTNVIPASLFSDNTVKSAIVTEARPANFGNVPAARISLAEAPRIPTTGMPESISIEQMISVRDRVAPHQVVLTGGRPIVSNDPIQVASNAAFANFQSDGSAIDDVVEQIPPAPNSIKAKAAEPLSLSDNDAENVVKENRAKARAGAKQAEQRQAAQQKRAAAAKKKVAAAEEAEAKALAIEAEKVDSLPAPIADTPEETTTAYVGSQPLPLAEAVRIALSQNKGIAVLGYLPQEIGTFVSTERSVFDPVFQADIRGGQFDQQNRNFINTGGLLPGGLAPGANEQRNDFLSGTDLNVLSITKMLESGGTVGAGVGMNYFYDTPVGDGTFLNPAWRSALNLSFEQPLGRGRGKNVTTAPLRIARANQSLASHEFQAIVNETLRDVQLAYWDWKRAQRDYEVTRDAVRTALETLELEKEAVRSGEGTLPDVEQASDQWQRFRIDEALALNDMKKARITLIQLMGLPLNDINYDFAIDEPAITTDVAREIGEVSAMARPEVLAAQANIRAVQLEVILAADTLRPDLNLRLDYQVTGLETGLDRAIETVSEHRFNNWIVQLEFTQAVGQRAACAALRRAQLKLARAIAEQDRVEQEIAAEVARTWEDVMTSAEQLRIQNERVATARSQVKGRNDLFAEGEGSLDLKIRAEASLVDALLKRQAAEVFVQQQIVRWQYVTGQQQYVQFVE
ncbi:TolC family protein [Rubripirellula tenax]|nr:TolC family protein [Rubripirellula tenax]